MLLLLELAPLIGDVVFSTKSLSMLAARSKTCPVILRVCENAGCGRFSVACFRPKRCLFNKNFPAFGAGVAGADLGGPCLTTAKGSLETGLARLFCGAPQCPTSGLGSMSGDVGTNAWAD